MSDQLYLGWQYATPRADPGPPPSLPLRPARYGLSDDWLAAQRYEERRLSRPLRVTAGAALGAGLALAAGAAAGLVTVFVAGPVIAACLAVAGRSGHAIWRGERGLRERAGAEGLRVERFRVDAEHRQEQDRVRHAGLVGQWQEQRSAFTRQKRWYAVPVPGGIDRVDVAGGTLAGWSAMLTMAVAYRLATGGEATVVDLSGGAVAADLARLCAAAGAPPAVWVLPGDLPRLDLAAGLSGGELADVLALSAAVTEEKSSARDLAVDTAILDRVIGVLEAGTAPGNSVEVRRVAAALRALAQVGDPQADLAAGLLTEREARALGTLYGQRATDRVVLERALGLEAQLRPLAAVGTRPSARPRGQLRILAVGRPASPQAAAAIGSFVVTALTHLIGRDPAEVQPGPASWRHTLFVLGAERLRDDVLDRLTGACEASRSGLVVAYRSMPPHVRQRIGRGNAAVVYMRLGNAEDAKAASEQIGHSHRFVLSQLTETVGTSVTDTLGGSYTSTVGDSFSAATSASDSDTRSAGTGRTSPSGAGVLPLRGGGSHSSNDGTSWGTSTSTSLTAGISTSTAWGVSTSRAAGDSESLARSLQRSRELVVEPAELQRLPATAMLITHGNGQDRQVLLADANPAIGALPVATFEQLPAPRVRPGPRFDFAFDERESTKLTNPPPPANRIASPTMDENTKLRPRLPIRAKLATTVGGAAATVSRLAGKGDGSVIGGVISLRLAPDLLSQLTAGRQVVLVTATNGKTTTTKLITAALAPLGHQVATNIYGANMDAGIISALSRAPHAPIAVLETDEKWIPSTVKATRPKVVALLNLSRDQMDRAAEIWLLARRWREALAAAPDCRVVANADDPLVAWSASSARQVTWVAAGQKWREDSWCCPNCGAHLQRDGDDWSCRECGLRRPPVSWVLAGDDVIDPSGRATRLDLALPGRANRANAVVALAVAEAFGVPLGRALREVRQVTSVAGRYTQVNRRGCAVRLLLAKNPAGWLEALDVMAPPPAPALLAVNAQGPDGRDTSWLWDVDFRRLRGRPVLVGGERRLDLAVRLEADDVAFQLVNDIDDAVDAALKYQPGTAQPSLDVLANYTAFQQYRVALGRVQ